MSGVLALVGGNEWQDKCSFDRGLLEASGGTEVLVLPTAAAYEHPQRAVEHAQRWFETWGGAFTLGLGLVEQVALIPHHEEWDEDQARRTIELAPKGLPVVGIDTQTALIRDPDGSWRTEGAGRVVVFTDGKEGDLKVLP